MKNLFNKFKSLFSQTSTNVQGNMVDFDKLLKAKDSKDKNEVIIELDNKICNLSSWGEKLNKLNTSQRTFYYNQELEREINNGGFNQFYFNSSGNYAHEVIDSLVAIGANKTAEIVRKANSQFPSRKVPKDRDERQKVLNQIEEKANEVWENFDQEFCQYEDDLNSLNLEFIKKNINDFR